MSWRCLEPEHKVRVRRQRYCPGCGRTWPTGSALWTWTGIWALDRVVMRLYMCQVCMAYYAERWDEDTELPGDFFWFDDPVGYAEVEKRMSLAVVVMEAKLDFVLPMQNMSDDRRRRLIRKGKVS